jgi:protein-S-isoprenylcysteine O-methyltransferase Ste14
VEALETKVPPPVVTLLVAGLMALVARWLPLSAPAGLGRLVAASVIAIAGLGVEAAGGITLILARTTVDPIHPRASRHLVTGGVYRMTRNPVYLGDLTILVAWAVYLWSPAALALSALFVLYIDRFQIRAEERVLSELFGEEYCDYLARTRRWL